MTREIAYNSQRDNIQYFLTKVSGSVRKVRKRFNAWWQCFSTSSWMFMSFYSSKIRAFGDDMLAKYLDDVEASVGKPGIAERVMSQVNYITGRTSFWWIIQKAGIEKWLGREGLKGSIVFIDRTMPFEQLYTLLESGPVILQTKKMGGLKGGHIILAVDYDKDGTIIAHDPFGNARTNYRDHNGSNVRYNPEWLKKYTGKKIRCIYYTEVKGA